MNVRRVFSRRGFGAGCSATLASLGIVRAPARAAQFSWKYGTDASADDPTTMAVIRAFARIRAETGGAVEFTPFLAGTLGSATAMISQIRLGAIDMLAMNGGTLDTVVPLASIEGIAYAFRDRQNIFAAMDGDLGRAIRNEFPSRGLVALERVWENGFRHITTSSKPIRHADDLQGMKLRVSTGKLYVDTFRSLGTTPTSIGLGEVYVALQTHLVDGQETVLVSIEDLRFYEVQKYLSLSHHMWAGHWMLFNREKWESLPRTFQEIIRKHMNAAAVAERQTNQTLQQAFRDKLQGQGLAVNEIDAASFRAKLSSSGYYSRWSKEYGPTAWSALEKYAGSLS